VCKLAGESFKKTQFEERILNQLNVIIRLEIGDKRLSMASVTKVDLARDFSHATVSWDTFDSGKRGEVKKSFDGAKGKLRSLLAKKLNVRHIPALSFIYDSQFEAEQGISLVLQEEMQSGKSF
jgi:ribosome-binding factor A